MFLFAFGISILVYGLTAVGAVVIMGLGVRMIRSNQNRRLRQMAGLAFCAAGLIVAAYCTLNAIDTAVRLYGYLT